MSKGAKTLIDRVRENVTYKGLLGMAVGFVTILGGVVTLHGAIVVPSVIAAASTEARDIIKEEIADHAEHPHHGAVTRPEFTALKEDIQEIKALVRDLK